MHVSPEMALPTEPKGHLRQGQDRHYPEVALELRLEGAGRAPWKRWCGSWTPQDGQPWSVGPRGA